MTPSGIEPATTGFVAQCLNQKRHRLQNIINNIIKTEHIKIRSVKDEVTTFVHPCIFQPSQETTALTTDINQISWPANHTEVLINTTVYPNVRIIKNAETVIKICVQKP